MSHTINGTHEKNLLKDVLNGQWGTIGPRSVEASALLAKKLGLGFGVSAFSVTAALEAVLRALNIGFGDEVIVASFSEPADSLVTAAVGATPVFADVDEETLTISCESVRELINDKTKAVIADLPAGNPCDAKALSSLLSEKGIIFIINLGDGYKTSIEGVLAAKYADVSILDISSGTALQTGEGGVILTDNENIFNAAFAYHNCGRPFGQGCTLEFDNIIGGDLRITEWQSCLVESRIESIDDIIEERKNAAAVLLLSLPEFLTPVKIIDGGKSSFSGILVRYNAEKNNGIGIDRVIDELCFKGIKAGRTKKAMHKQPVFSSDYFKKLTGKTEKYSDLGLYHSIDAENNTVLISL